MCPDVVRTNAVATLALIYGNQESTEADRLLALHDHARSLVQVRVREGQGYGSVASCRRE